MQIVTDQIQATGIQGHIKHVRAADIAAWLRAKFKTGARSAWRTQGHMAIYINGPVAEGAAWPLKGQDEAALIDVLKRSGIAAEVGKCLNGYRVFLTDLAIDVLSQETGTAPSKPKAVKTAKDPADALASELQALRGEFAAFRKEVEKMVNSQRLSVERLDREHKGLRAALKKNEQG